MMKSPRHRRLLVSFVGVLALVGGAFYALASTRARIDSTMVALSTMSTEASAIAHLIKTQTPSAELRSEIESIAEDLDARGRDLSNPARMVAYLSEACRGQGAVVLEIAPVPPKRDPQGRLPQSGSGAGKQYRLVIRAPYRNIASLLDQLSRERLPARVVELNVSPPEKPDHANRLMAVIVLESYQPPASSNAPTTLRRRDDRSAASQLSRPIRQEPTA